MRKKFWLSLTFSFALGLDLSATPIGSYQELTSAIRMGKSFVILLDLQHCTGNSGMPLGYFIPKAMMVMPATKTTCGRVVTSNLHLSNWSGNPTYEYVKFTINADNTALIHTTFYDPNSFTAIGEVHTFNCSLDNGLEIHTDD